jgi:putative transposase
MSLLPGMKQSTLPGLKLCSSTALQDVCTSLDLAWRDYLKGVKGPPRKYQKLTSMTYRMYKSKIRDAAVFVPKVGLVKARIHRPIQGAVRQLTVRTNPIGDWYYLMVTEEDIDVPEYLGRTAVGIDVGLSVYATTSAGKEYKIPKWPLHDIARLRRRVQLIDTEAHRRALYKATRRQRRRQIDWMHKLSREIVDNWDLIVIEDLNLAALCRGRGWLPRAMKGARFGTFFEMLRYKARRSGKRLVKVNPAYTSRTCSVCGQRQGMTLSDRVFNCKRCGCSVGRDVGAARNILKLGLKCM